MRHILISLLAIHVVACNESPTAPTPAGPLSVVRLRGEPFSYAYASSALDAQRLVIRDTAALNQVWSSLWRMSSPAPPLPSVDFARDMVIVAALGQRPTGGFSIFVDKASESSNGVTVEIRSVSPGTGCALTLALTQPVDVAVMPRRDTPVAFVERADVQNCL